MMACIQIHEARAKARAEPESRIEAQYLTGAKQDPDLIPRTLLFLNISVLQVLAKDFTFP